MLTAIIGVIGFIIDRVAKLLTIKYVKPVGSISFIDGVINFTYVENRGAAHGILQGQVVPLIVVTCIAVVGIVFFLCKKYGKLHTVLKVAAGLVLAGAVGNLFDRIFYGYVVDMVEFAFFQYPVFNLADNMLVFGTILICVYILFIDKEFFSSKKDKVQEEKNTAGEKADEQ